MNDTDEREDTTASSPRDPHDDGARMEDPRAPTWRVSVPSKN